MNVNSSGCSTRLVRRRKGSLARHQREGGYLLLAIMLTMAFMVITLTYVVAPSLVQQMKRDREEEMIHRGTEYARAIKKFYKKNGRYPASLDDLDKGQIRYLRKRYKDPLTKGGKWKLLHYGDIQTLLNTAAPGTPAAALGQPGGAFGSPGGFGSTAPQGGTFGVNRGAITPGGLQSQPTTSSFGGSSPYGGQNPGVTSGFATNTDEAASALANAAGNAPGGSNQTAGTGSDQASASTPTSATGPNASPNADVFGGGAVVGVASVSKDKTIRIYNKKKTYDEWQFIYNPAMDQQNVLLRGPYQPTTIGNTNIGTPAGQLNQQNGQQNSPFGNSGFGQNNSAQPNSTFGQPTSSGFGQQNNFPPDQNQPR